MPTAAKLFAAVYFAVFAWILGMLVHNSINAVSDYPIKTGLMKHVFAFIGILVGWIVMGKRSGEGRSYAVQGGVLSGVAVVVWAIVFFAIRAMVKEATKMKYPDTPAAIMGGFQIAIDYVRDYWNVSIVLFVLLGGALGGIVAEWAAKRWS